MARALLLMIALLVTACASSGPLPQPRISPENPLGVPIPEFVEQQRRLRLDLERGVPRQLSEEEWHRLDRIHTTLDRLLHEIASVDQLSDAERQSMYRLHGELLGLVGETESDPLVCARVHRTGTRHGGQRYCLPQSEWDLGRAEAQDTMRHINAMARPAPR